MFSLTVNVLSAGTVKVIPGLIVHEQTSRSVFRVVLLDIVIAVVFNGTGLFSV
ncbi:hypothetical protein D3C85_859720 [compost metagenome]